MAGEQIGVNNRRHVFHACAIGLALSVSPLAAQSTPCGITSIQTANDLIYPPIARAARVQGTVIFLVNFDFDGLVDKLIILSGPEMLRGQAEAYVKGFHVNEYGGPRQCPIVINFAIGKETDNPRMYLEKLDLQHVRITAETFPLQVQYSVASK